MFGLLRGMSFRKKIIFPLAIVCGIFTASALYSVSVVQKISADAERLGRVYLPVITDLLQADRDLYQALAAESTMYYESTVSKQLRSDHSSNAKQVLDRGMKSLNMGSVDDAPRNIQRFTTLYDDWKQKSLLVIEAVENDDATAAQARAAAEVAFSKLRDLIDVVQESQMQKSAASTEKSVAQAEALSYQLMVMLAVGLGLCLLIMLVVPSMVIAPVNEVESSISQIAQGNGDLTARVPVHTNDEVGQLSSRFNQFMTTLHQLISQTISSAQNVSSVSADIGRSSRDNLSLIDQQNKLIETVVTAVVQMKVAINDVASNTSEAASNAEQSKRLSEDGMAKVTETIALIESVSQQTAKVSGLVNGVNKQMDSINTVLEVIRGVAEQTNLLALNAAIEAARAGEYGRGFSVVADEVRILASRTEASTSDIQEIIAGLKTSVGQAVDEMKKSVDFSSSTMAVANEAGQSLINIDGSVDAIAGRSMHTASLVEEQSAVIESIDGHLTVISQQSSNISNNAQHSVTNSDSLSAEAGSLMQRVGQFQV